MHNSPSTKINLVVRLRDPRDDHAWQEFVEVYEPLVHRLARSAGLQRADAEDLAQDVFRAVAVAISRWEPDPSRGSFRGWLFRIARNLIINLLEHRKRHPGGTGDDRVEKLIEQSSAADPEVSALFDDECQRQFFEWAVTRVQRQFAESTWQAFWQTTVENRSPEEVAEALGIRVGSVYVYRNRVMLRLKRVIQQLEGT